VAAPPESAARTEFVVTYAGNLDPYQDLDVLFAAFERLRMDCPAAVLEVVTHEEHWRTRLDARGAGLVALGAVRVRVEPEYGGVFRRMAQSDVLVCPRSSWSGYPIKLVNYAMAARPIVVAAGSAKGLADEDSALVVADRDVHALAQALLRLHDEPELAARLARAARRRATAMGEGAEFASQLDAIYGKIRAERAGRRGQGSSLTSRLRRIAGGRISTRSPDGGQR
jgi:glycosyltransferase involved in cell wall biosynthesis